MNLVRCLAITCGSRIKKLLTDSDFDLEVTTATTTVPCYSPFLEN